MIEKENIKINRLSLCTYFSARFNSADITFFIVPYTFQKVIKKSC